MQLCPGDVCEVKEKQDIQKVSKSQLLILLTFIGFVILVVYFMNDKFTVQPNELTGNAMAEQRK